MTIVASDSDVTLGRSANVDGGVAFKRGAHVDSGTVARGGARVDSGAVRSRGVITLGRIGRIDWPEVIGASLRPLVADRSDPSLLK